MKLTKLSLVVLAAFSTTAMAQTTVGTTGSNTTVQGGSTTTIKANEYVNIKATQATIIDVNGTKTTITKNGIDTKGSMTAAKIYTQGLDVGNELINHGDSIVRNNASSIARDNVINDNITATNVRIDDEVARATAAETSLENRKADKTTVEANRVTAAAATALVQTNLNTEVQARIDGDQRAEQNANSYTDNRVTTVDNRVTAVDNRVTAVDNRVTKVETKTQNITATAGNTYIKGDTFIDGNISAGSGIVDRGARRGEGIYEGKAIANGNDLMSIRQEAMKYAGQVGANTLSQANNYTDQRIGEVRRETNQVGAMAMAASIVGNVSPAPGKNFALTAGMGSYGGQAALAVGFTHRVAQNVQWTASVSTVSGGRTGVGAGVSWSF